MDKINFKPFIQKQETDLLRCFIRIYHTTRRSVPSIFVYFIFNFTSLYFSQGLSSNWWCVDNTTAIVSLLRMPLVKPVRDLKTVRCVRRYKDKNGETKYNLRVLFNYVDILSFLGAEIICTFILTRRSHPGIWPGRKSPVRRNFSRSTTLTMMASSLIFSSKAPWRF